MNSHRLACLALVAAALGGCTSSARFDGLGTGSVRSGSERIDGTFNRGGPVERPVARAPSDDDIAPTARAAESAVTVETLTPPPGAVAASPDPSTSTPDAPVSAGTPNDGRPPVGAAASAAGGAGAPGLPSPQPDAQPPASPDRRVASLPPRAAEPAVRSGNVASAVAGTWTVTDAGDRCRITLTSAPLFEFYRASPQNCRAPSLARVNAWELRGEEVVLIQQGGRVAARLSPQGSGYTGSTATGAPVTMSR